MLVALVVWYWWWYSSGGVGLVVVVVYWLLVGCVDSLCKGGVCNSFRSTIIVKVVVIFW